MSPFSCISTIHHSSYHSLSYNLIHRRSMPFRSVTQLLCYDNYFLAASLPFSTPARSSRPFLSTRHIALFSFTCHINSLETSFSFRTSIFISHILSLPVLHSLPISHILSLPVLHSLPISCNFLCLSFTLFPSLATFSDRILFLSSYFLYTRLLISPSSSYIYLIL